MPMKPTSAEKPAPTRKKTERPTRTPPVVGGQQEQQQEDQRGEDGERLELPATGTPRRPPGPPWRSRSSSGVPWPGGEHLPGEQAGEAERHERDQQDEVDDQVVAVGDGGELLAVDGEVDRGESRRSSECSAEPRRGAGPCPTARTPGGPGLRTPRPAGRVPTGRDGPAHTGRAEHTDRSRGRAARRRQRDDVRRLSGRAAAGCPGRCGRPAAASACVTVVPVAARASTSTSSTRPVSTASATSGSTASPSASGRVASEPSSATGRRGRARRPGRASVTGDRQPGRVVGDEDLRPRSSAACRALQRRPPATHASPTARRISSTSAVVAGRPAAPRRAPTSRAVRTCAGSGLSSSSTRAMTGAPRD